MKRKRNQITAGSAILEAVSTPGRVAPNPGRGSFARCVQEVSRKGVDDPRAVCAAAKRKAGEVLNPADLAAEAFEAFHGFPPKEEIVFESMEHEHEFYAGIGDLEELVIVPQRGNQGHPGSRL